MSIQKFKKFFYLLCALSALLVVSCSPQKRLDRLIQNHQELIKTDTIYSVKTFTLPAIKIDTGITVSYKMEGLDELFSTYKNKIDSLQNELLKKDVKSYIINRKCLEDTFTVKLKHGGWCKIYQSGKKIVYQMYEPEKKIYVRYPTSINKVNAVIKYSWPMFFGGFFLAILLIFCGLMILGSKIKNPVV
jgi:hypothetical protein